MSDLTEIQIKVSFIESALEEFNTIVTRQNNELMALQKHNELLLERIKRLEQSLADNASPLENIGHERPPHY